MKAFTINNENNITVYASKKEATDADSGAVFVSEEQLAALESSRLVEIWNTLPGVTPVKKFKDRPTAAARVWKAIQSLEPVVAPEKPQDAPKKVRKGRTATLAAEAHKGHDNSKKATVLALVQREGGATLAEIMKATSWQKHSVRGFISGMLGKKMGLTVKSAKREDGERSYSVAS